ncbi:hypothetical protein [Macrococcus animalis]|uniref:hypothetical protein n=1 Tax=Macrococcus animalis TaxID=3395467 RepID=UPI0039BE050B
MFKNLKFQIAFITLIYLVFIIWFVSIGGHKNLIIFSFFIVTYFTGILSIIREHKMKHIDKNDKIAIHHAKIKNHRNNSIENLILLIIYSIILYFLNIHDIFLSLYFMVVLTPGSQFIGHAVSYFMEKEELQITLNKKKTTS